MRGINKMILVTGLLLGNLVTAQESAVINMQAGKKLKEQGKCADAIIYFVKALELKSDYAEALYESGWCYNEMKDFARAAGVLSKANSLQKNNPGILYELGYAYYNLDSADLALALYKKVLLIDTAHLQTLIGIGDIYRNKKSNVYEALRWYLRALLNDQTNIKANYGAGWCYNELKDYTRAVPYLLRVVQQDSVNYAALNELGFSYYSQNKFEEAINTLSVSESASVKSETALYYLGLCYVKTGKKQDAVKRYNALVLMNSKLAPALLAEIQKM